MACIGAISVRDCEKNAENTLIVRHTLRRLRVNVLNTVFQCEFIAGRKMAYYKIESARFSRIKIASENKARKFFPFKEVLWPPGGNMFITEDLCIFIVLL